MSDPKKKDQNEDVANAREAFERASPEVKRIIKEVLDEERIKMSMLYRQEIYNNLARIISNNVR